MQVVAHSETILNVFCNYVRNKYITVDDKDAVWMNETVKPNIKAKNALNKKHIQNGRFESDFVYLQNLIIKLNELISSTKTLCYENLAKKFVVVASKNLLTNSRDFIMTKNPINSTSLGRQ